jgi:hypothetical protein
MRFDIIKIHRICIGKQQPILCEKNPTTANVENQNGTIPWRIKGDINELMNYNLKPDSLPDEVVETFSTAAQIAGKTVRTLFGYIFAANLECPDLNPT